ncbi:uncharacterized protein LOC116178206 [Photinus pyralis]|uniref:uncharacterized protein LOC116178206 n=1 Tax=Photinus pyralis TaxID=7054 RepID=UPI0012672CC3|nr:uncharacterized protein LOC116178206 [Photinus pyralis]
MADDSESIVEEYNFHPCNTPRGTKYYDTKILTTCQKDRLRELKKEKVRENEQYLATHPEIRALVALATRHVLQERPRAKLHEHIAHFFSQERGVLERAVQEYIAARPSLSPVAEVNSRISNVEQTMVVEQKHSTFGSIINDILSRTFNCLENSSVENRTTEIHV